MPEYTRYITENEIAEKSWRRLDGESHLGYKVADGMEIVKSQAQTVAAGSLPSFKFGGSSQVLLILALLERMSDLGAACSATHLGSASDDQPDSLGFNERETIRPAGQARDIRRAGSAQSIISSAAEINAVQSRISDTSVVLLTHRARGLFRVCCHQRVASRRHAHRHEYSVICRRLCGRDHY